MKKIEDALEELMQQGCVQFTLGDLEDITGIERKQIRRLLLPFEAAERIIAVRKSHMGNIYAFTQPALPDDETAETIVQSESVKSECASRTYVISALKEKMKTGIGHARTIAQELLDYIQEGKMQFTTHEIAKELDISYIGTRNSLAYYFKYGMIRHADPKVNNQCFVFSFVPENYETPTECEHDICDAPAVESTAEPQFNVFQETTKQNICYSDAVMDMISVLEKSETSQKDRRIGRIIRQCLTKGKVMKDDYSAEGEQSKWNPDMRFAVQLGLLEKVSSSEYTIRTELDSTCKNLSTTQKCTLSVLYDIFGDGMFSVDMAVANLDYSSSYVSGILHQFTIRGYSNGSCETAHRSRRSKPAR